MSINDARTARQRLTQQMAAPENSFYPLRVEQGPGFPAAEQRKSGARGASPGEPWEMIQPQRGERKSPDAHYLIGHARTDASLQSVAPHANCIIHAAVTSAALDSNTASGSE